MAKDNPEFVVFCGPMFSEKSSRLLLALEKHRHQHKNVSVFKSDMDDRFSTNEIVTHNGWRVPARPVKQGIDILEALSESDGMPDVVAVDEAFMVSGVADVLIWLYRTGITIVVSSLDMSSAGKPFKEVEKMLPWATRIEKCVSVCIMCGRNASYTHKKNASKEEIEVGGMELYEPRCAECHPVIHIDRG